MTIDPFSSALDLAAAVRRREVSPTELAELFLERIERFDPELNAFVHRADDDVRAAAAAATDAVTATPAGDLPPFHGVPLPIKDLNKVAGWPCTFGSRAARPGPADADDLVVERFRAAGFVLAGHDRQPRAGHHLLHREPGPRPHPQPVGHRAHARRVQRRARPRPSPRAWRPSPTAATAAGPSASRRRAAAWWA